MKIYTNSVIMTIYVLIAKDLKMISRNKLHAVGYGFNILIERCVYHVYGN